MNMRKRLKGLLSLWLTAIMVAGLLLPVEVRADFTGTGCIGTHTDSSNNPFTSVTNTNTNLTGGNYYLDADVAIVVESGEVNLCLNGKNLTSLEVKRDATLNLYDCGGSSGNEGMIKETITNSGTVNVYGCIISPDASTDGGPAVVNLTGWKGNVQIESNVLCGTQIAANASEELTVTLFNRDNPNDYVAVRGLNGSVHRVNNSSGNHGSNGASKAEDYRKHKIVYSVVFNSATGSTGTNPVGWGIQDDTLYDFTDSISLPEPPEGKRSFIDSTTNKLYVFDGWETDTMQQDTNAENKITGTIDPTTQKTITTPYDLFKTWGATCSSGEIYLYSRWVEGYTVTATNASGSGDYAEKASVTITANAAPQGQRFAYWDGVDSLTFTSGSKTTATATFTMPASAVTVTAVYANIPVDNNTNSNTNSTPAETVEPAPPSLDEVPKTGENSETFGLSAILMLSFGGLVIWTARKRKLIHREE